MNKLISFIKQKWIVQIFGVVAICAVIWYAGPFLGIANRTPLNSEFNRLLAILAIVVFWVIYNIIQRVRTENKNKEMIERMKASEADRTTVEDEVKEQQQQLQIKFEDALQILKTRRSKGRYDTRYLYELPWYVIIGIPGSGKTTLLENSGLVFPLKKYKEGKADKKKVRGIGGTRNCDWLFTDEAVFIDTAGRYMTQDAHEPVDSAAWKEFLELIKKYRPRRPVNGILVATSMFDIFHQTDMERRDQAEIIRKRILEIHDELGIQFPVYMVFTKWDLIAGFNDFFSYLRPEEREQVWGRTFHEIDEKRTDKNIEKFTSDFDELITRLDQRLLSRLHEETDIRRRSLIINFPRQAALAKLAINDFITHTFSYNAYDRVHLLLRGVYFTSATQEGKPVDHIWKILSKTYGLGKKELPVYTGEPKGFFIKRLINKVILTEADMAGTDMRVEQRNRAWNYAAYGSVLLISALIFASWAISFVKNKSYITEVQKKLKVYNEKAPINEDWNIGVKHLHQQLQALQVGRQVRSGSSWMGMGLDQRKKINDRLDTEYDRLLREQLLPVIKNRLEQRLSADIRHFDAGNLEDTAEMFNLLKIYLMLERPMPKNRKSIFDNRNEDQRAADAELAAVTIVTEWDKRFHRESKNFRTEYKGHVRDLFLRDVMIGTTTLNRKLIEAARERLNREPLHKQIYNQLESRYIHDITYELCLGNIPHIDDVFTYRGGRVKKVCVPGLFTADGYDGLFVKEGSELVKIARNQNWVTMNTDADENIDQDILYDDLKRLYFINYIEKWDDLLNRLSIRRSKTMDDAGRILHRLTAKNNPLRELLVAIEKNTAFLKDEVEGSDVTYRKIKRLDELTQLVKTKDGMPPLLDETVAKLAELRDFMYRYDSPETALDDFKSRKPDSNIASSAGNHFKQLPKPLKGWLTSLTSSGQKAALNATKSAMNTIWKADVYDFYQETLAGRYPLAQSSEDALLDDFVRFFEPRGIIDRFLTENIKPFVDADWREKNVSGSNIGLSGEALAQFKKSERIKEMFFAEDGSPNISFSLTPIRLDASIKEFRLTISGKTIAYSHGRQRTESFQWLVRSGRLAVEWEFRTFDDQTLQGMKEGPWAWFRTLDEVDLTRQSPNRFSITFKNGGYTAQFRMQAGSALNPFGSTELKTFSCPNSL